MHPLIYKTTLETERSLTWLSPSTTLDLAPLPDGAVAAFARRTALWPFGSEKRFLVGTLHADAAEFMSPLLHGGARLRVRIVALVPSHLTPDGAARVAISVWGDAPVAMGGADVS